MSYECTKCNKFYKSNSSLWNHNKKYHKKEKVTFKCRYCDLKFNHTSSRCRHEKTCKTKKVDENIDTLPNQINNNNSNNANNNSNNAHNANNNLNNANNNLNNTNNTINNKVNNIINTDTNLINENKKLKKEIDILKNTVHPINNQLINIIVDRTNALEKLQNENKKEIVIDNIKDIIEPDELVLNEITIISRSEDGYINAKQLCQAGNKQFNDWYKLKSTKELIDVLRKNEEKVNMETSISQFVDIKKNNSANFEQNIWIHPDLAIQLAQWISPEFTLQVSRWIRTLFVKRNTILEKEIQQKDMRIKILENTYVKKHKRLQYPEKNVIYMITNEANKKNRIYIIGKTTDLTNRLTTYNKSEEHEVIYYRECNSEDHMNIVENIVLYKLNDYREKANRDRVVLPIGKEITLFTNIIDKSVNC